MLNYEIYEPATAICNNCGEIIYLEESNLCYFCNTPYHKVLIRGRIITGGVKTLGDRHEAAGILP